MIAPTPPTTPVRRVTPGRVLYEWLAEAGLTQRELEAKLAGMLDHRAISDVARDGKTITPFTAVCLEIGTGKPAIEWLALYWAMHLPKLRETVQRMIAEGGRAAGHHSRTAEIIAMAYPTGRVARGKLGDTNKRKPARKKAS